MQVKGCPLTSVSAVGLDDGHELQPLETMMRRVVQFSTGNVGQHSLKAIIGRPDLELVGLHAASPNKIGRDAAELCAPQQVQPADSQRDQLARSQSG